MIKIPEKLKIIQKISGLTQEQLAKKAGVSFVAFNNWITGKAEPRKGAQEKIDELYLLYTGEKKIPVNLLSAKKTALAQKRKKHKDILKEILSRPDIFDQFVLKMTYNSNKIEGSTLSEGETGAILFQNAAIPNKTLVEVLEAKNHQTAIEFLFDQLKGKKEIDEKLILRLHTILLNGINPDAGFYRRYGVRIVGANITTANHLKVPELMSQLVLEISKGNTDAISECVKIHSDFEKIHPFGDGNGRIGRLIMQGMLLKRNLPPAIIRQDKKVLYLQYLNKLQTTGDSSLLEDFICDAIFDSFEILEQ